MADQLGFGPGDELSWMNTYFLIGKCNRSTHHTRVS